MTNEQTSSHSLLDLDRGDSITPALVEAFRLSNILKTICIVLLCMGGAALILGTIYINVYLRIHGTALIAIGVLPLILSKLGFRHTNIVLLLLFGAWLLGFAAYDNSIGIDGYLWLNMFPIISMCCISFFWGRISRIAFFFGIATILFVPVFKFPVYQLATSTKICILLSYVCVATAVRVAEYGCSLIVKEVHKLVEQMREVSVTDELTKLRNRRALYEILEYTFGTIERSGRSFSIILADIDHFKKINDTYGHACGDAALVHLANVMRSALRKQDVLGRWGGEEFLFILPETGIKGAEFVAEKIKKVLVDHPFISKTSTGEDVCLKITLSMGVQECYGGDGIPASINMADRKLYKAKNSGRNHITCCLDEVELAAMAQEESAPANCTKENQ